MTIKTKEENNITLNPFRCGQNEQKLCELKEKQEIQGDKLHTLDKRLTLVESESKSTRDIAIDIKHELLGFKKIMLGFIVTIISGVMISVLGAVIIAGLKGLIKFNP